MWDRQTTGELVVPVSLGYFPPMVDNRNEVSSECGEGNSICLKEGPNAPGCEAICIELKTSGQIPLPPTYKNPVELSLIVRIPGRPPKTTLTLPQPGVEAVFQRTEPPPYYDRGTRYDEFPVTGGSVTAHLEQGEFVVDVEAMATTPEGETISVRNGRYALVNFGTVTTCQQD